MSIENLEKKLKELETNVKILNEELIDEMRVARKASGITEEELARELGVSKSYISLLLTVETPTWKKSGLGFKRAGTKPRYFEFRSKPVYVYLEALKNLSKVNKK